LAGCLSYFRVAWRWAGNNGSARRSVDGSDARNCADAGLLPAFCIRRKCGNSWDSASLAGNLVFRRDLFGGRSLADLQAKIRRRGIHQPESIAKATVPMEQEKTVNAAG